MLRGYTRKDKTDSALEVIGMMLEQGLRPTVEMYNDIIFSAAKHANHSIAWRCFLDMQRLALFTPTALT